jgi:WhiB family redox-sensing transcriptional regulator
MRPVARGNPVRDALGFRPGAALSWIAGAVCAQTDPEVFHPDKGLSARDARQVCVGCPVRVECLAYAMDNDERFGVWGGLSERQRRELRRQATREAA